MSIERWTHKTINRTISSGPAHWALFSICGISCQLTRPRTHTKDKWRERYKHIHMFPSLRLRLAIANRCCHHPLRHRKILTSKQPMPILWIAFSSAKMTFSYMLDFGPYSRLIQNFAPFFWAEWALDEATSIASLWSIQIVYNQIGCFAGCHFGTQFGVHPFFTRCR